MPRRDLDDIDRRILTQLQRDSKLTNVELAARVGLSPSPCLTRVKQLERDGVIRGHVALLDPEAPGLSISVFIQVTLEKQVERALATFEQKMMGFPEVMECYLMSGSGAADRARHSGAGTLHRQGTGQYPRRVEHPVQLRAEAGEIQDRPAGIANRRSSDTQHIVLYNIYYSVII